MYSDPVTAICKIHNRNADRLDPLSSTTKLVVGEKNRTNTREFYMYNLRGVMEICRLSTHPGGFMAFETIWNFCTFFVYLFEITHKNDHLAPLSSLSELDNEVGGRMRIVSICCQQWSIRPPLRDESRRYVKQRCAICVVSWKFLATAPIPQPTPL